MWARSSGLPYMIRFRTGDFKTERVRRVSRLLRMTIYGGRSGDYITEVRAGTKVAPSLVRRVAQACFKLTTYGAFVTISGSLETEFPG